MLYVARNNLVISNKYLIIISTITIIIIFVHLVIAGTFSKEGFVR